MMKRLSDVCTKGSSNIAQKDLDTRSGDYPIYGASGFIKNVDFYHQEKPYIAIVKDGAGVGRVMKLPAKSSVIGTMQYIIPNEDVSVDYLAYALEHMNLSKYYLGAAIPHIYFKDYCNEPLPNHTVEEQETISHMLGVVCNSISLRKQQLSKLDELVKSRFIEMFGDPVSNDKGWPHQAMDKVAPSSAYSGVNSEKVWLLNLDMVEAQTGRIIGYLYVDKEQVGNSTCGFDEGNVLYSKLRPYLNKVVVPNQTGYCTTELVPLRPNAKLNRQFLAYLLRSDAFVSFINEKVAGAKMPRVSMNVFREFECILPPIELQNQFAAFVEQVDKSKLAIQKSLEKLETLKKSLMQKYFG